MGSPDSSLGKGLYVGISEYFLGTNTSFQKFRKNSLS